MALSSVELRPRIGAEILADREALLSGRHAAELRDLLEQRGVLVVRELGFEDDEQLAFSETLGEVLQMMGQGVMKIALDKQATELAELFRGSFVWHIDRTDQDVPTRASILTARRLADQGGDTEFANTYAAWDDLPERDKRRLETLRVVHDVAHGLRMVTPDPTPEQEARWRQSASKVHPLVWTHRSGRKSLVLGSTASAVEGMPLEAGRALLQELLDWATQPKFVYRHRWKVGDLLMWDNTGTMHRAEPYAADSGRLMHRTTLVGEEALA